MDVTLRGSSPAAMTAGIMLLTRARQLGYPLTVSVVGDPLDLRTVRGPAVMYAPVLASCGVGREHGSGATVVIPGPPGAPLRVSVTPHGIGGWFLVDRTGAGAHPATAAFVRLSSDPRLDARHLGKEVRRAMVALGLAPEPAVLDVLFGAPAPALLRLAIALRAGRAMSGGRGEAITRFLAGEASATGDPVPEEASALDVVAMLRARRLDWVLARLSPLLRDRMEDWIEKALRLAEEDGGRDLELLSGLAKIASQLAVLPPWSVLPPLGAAEDSVAVALSAALSAEGVGDANQQLRTMFSFLGGRFVPEAEHALFVHAEVPPAEPDNVVALLEWFSQEVRAGRKQADVLFDQIFHPFQ